MVETIRLSGTRTVGPLPIRLFHESTARCDPCPTFTNMYSVLSVGSTIASLPSLWPPSSAAGVATAAPFGRGAAASRPSADDAQPDVVGADVTIAATAEHDTTARHTRRVRDAASPRPPPQLEALCSSDSTSGTRVYSAIVDQALREAGALEGPTASHTRDPFLCV